MGELRDAYASARERVQDLVRTLDRAPLGTAVPACPDWTVKDLVAHVTGVAADALAGNIGNVGGRDWTTSQVHARRDLTVGDILEEWNQVASQIEPALDELHPTMASALVGDIVTHEHDLRGAIGNREARDTDGVVIAAGFYARNFGKRLKDAALPTIVVEAGDHRWTAGRDEPAGSVRAPLFEMLRGLTGRRTTEQVAAFDWSVDPQPYLDLFSSYPPATRPLNE